MYYYYYEMCQFAKRLFFICSPEYLLEMAAETAGNVQLPGHPPPVVV